MPKKTLATILKERTAINTTLAQIMKSCEIGVWKEIVNNN